MTAQNPGHALKNDPQEIRNAARDIDPNIKQSAASNPESSVWVSASAGTGKTKVLTDRILRLMLSRNDGQAGTLPSKILAITFTKAGANEMTLRVGHTLSAWAVMEDDKLKSELHDLLRREIKSHDMLCARRLFADVVDLPGGLKIMTIHSFCQSVLSRFPLEAGLPPFFTLLNEAQSAALMSAARDQVFKAAQSDKNSPAGAALQAIAQTINEDQFAELISAIVSERRQINRLLERHFNIDGLYTALCLELGIQPGLLPGDVILAGCSDDSFDLPALKTAMQVLLDSKNQGDNDKGQSLGLWLSQTPSARSATFDDYMALYFTDKGEIRARLATKDAINAIDALKSEAERLLILQNTLKTAANIQITREILTLGFEIIHQYQNLKSKQAALDYDDLILKTLDLLEGRTMAPGKVQAASWVLFKLDQGFDHILIDEAQDTNPEQWRIIEALCAEFFSGDGAGEQTRTVFTVGDEKQSIFSFQRASPEEFARMRALLKTKVTQAQKQWDDIDLNISFRSAQSILRAVDATFAPPEVKRGLAENIEHISFRTQTKGQPGHVELWPVHETEQAQDSDPWDPPLQIHEIQTGAVSLANKIATTIKYWLDRSEILESHGRPIQPGDIMILVRTRTLFFEQLARALKSQNIPIRGVDRMKIGEQLAVQDLNAGAEFALLPTDDLALAGFLKSPLVGIDEKTLFNFSHGRTGTLWKSVQNNAPPAITAYLKTLISKAGAAQPFEFFSHILNTPCPANENSGLQAIKARLGEDALDPLDEYLRAALNVEQAGIQTLQAFLHAQSREDNEVKRELSESGSAVRLMTVHGSKGLQAPIVIMPDTMRTSASPPAKISRRLVWFEKTSGKYPLFAPRKDEECNFYQNISTHAAEREDQEYRRLLYVAMTRAEDRLYIAGYKGTKNSIPSSWYNYVKQGLQSLSETETLDDGTLILKNHATQIADKKEKIHKPSGLYQKLPTWSFKNAAPEESQRVATASHLSETDLSVSSPLKGLDTYRFRRGNLTHKLLEILPNLEPNSRQSAAISYLDRFATDLPPDVQADITRETLNVLNHPEFAKIFSPAAIAEIPVTGYTTSGAPINGQIDRLLITDDEILIIDYKTNRPPPRNPADVPALYQSQMQAYADILKDIYPGRALRAALLWTDGPFLMPLSLA